MKYLSYRFIYESNFIYGKDGDQINYTWSWKLDILSDQTTNNEPTISNRIIYLERDIIIDL